MDKNNLTPLKRCFNKSIIIVVDIILKCILLYNRGWQYGKIWTFFQEFHDFITILCHDIQIKQTVLYFSGTVSVFISRIQGIEGTNIKIKP